MRSVLRAFAVVASLAIIAGFGRPAFAGPAPPTPPMDERQIRRWSDWWIKEAERHTLPTPQLLYLNSLPWRARESDLRIGLIWAPGEFKILYPLCFPDKHEWFQFQANPKWVETEAFVIPTGLEIRYIFPCFEALCAYPISGSRLPLYHLESWSWPVFSLFLPKEYAGPFSWAKKIKAPATIRPTAFSEAQFEDNASLKWNIQKRLPECGDLGLFEYGYRINLVRNHPFFSSPNHCE